ncbi:hypothetical protein [Nocardioides alcanivorans]|uniref:hypothetical protein n=1 Tax=Nocardioides alcanivorans TaxID=2897352 RepID=UPI001F1AE7C6|nr:hypothetical protein [Nocardioides alcanivorans]
MGAAKSNEPNISFDGVDCIVVDTNFGPHGYPDMPRLKQLAASAQRVGIRVGVPEVVVWEWAEHLQQKVSAAFTATRQANGAMLKGGLGAIATPVASTADKIAIELARAVQTVPNLVLIPASERNARDALRDQILQQGGGSKKNEVKTGAADSAWIRDAVEWADGDTTRLVFASENLSDITAVCEHLKIKAPASGSEKQVTGSLEGLEPRGFASKDVVELRRYIRSVLPQYARGGVHGDESSSEIPLWLLTVEEDGLGDLPEGAVVQAVEVIGLTRLTAVTDEEVGTRPQSTTVRARFTFVGDVEVDYYMLDVNGEVQSSSEIFSDISVSTELQFSKEDGTWAYESSFDTYVNDAPPSGYDESNDYLAEVVETLCFHLGEIPDEWPTEGEPEQQFERQGVEVTVSFDGDPYGDWTIDIEVGKASAHVGSTYDPGSWVWAGKDGFHSRPPYEPSFWAVGVGKASSMSLDAWLRAVLPD